MNYSHFKIVTYVLAISSINLAFGTVDSIKTEQEFQEYIQHPAVVIKFSTTWCGACTASAPEFEKISNNSTYANIRFAQADLDALSSTGQSYDVSAIPTFLYFSSGKKLGMLVGPNMDQLKKDINTYLLDKVQNTTETTQLQPEAEESVIVVEEESPIVAEESRGFMDSVSDFFKKTWDSVSSFTRQTIDKVKEVFSRS